MLTKRQQQVLQLTNCYPFFGIYPASSQPGYYATAGAGYVGHSTLYYLMDSGLLAFAENRDVCITPTGQRLATILAELPAPLTRRQWQILLRFRDVGSDSSSKYTSTFRAGNGMWQLPCTESEWHTWSQSLPGTNERTMRTLCDYGLIGFEYIPFSSTPYAHLTPLGEELVSLLP